MRDDANEHPVPAPPTEPAAECEPDEPGPAPVPASGPALTPPVEDTGYTAGGVPTFDSVREKIETRYGTAQGARNSTPRPRRAAPSTSSSRHGRRPPPSGSHRSAHRCDPTPTRSPGKPDACAHSPPPSAGTGWRAGTSSAQRRDVPPIPELTATVVGWHATDPATPYLSLWARMPGFAVADLDTELYQRRSLVKQLAMRRTLWLVNADDMLGDDAAGRQRPGRRQRTPPADRRRREGRASPTDGDRWLDTACTAVLRHLRRARPRQQRRTAGRATRTGRHIRPGARKALGRCDSAGTAGADGAVRARRHHPRTQRGLLDHVAAPLGAYRGLAGLRTSSVMEAARGPGRIAAALAAHLRAGHRRPTSNGGSAPRSPRSGRHFEPSTPSRWTCDGTPATRCPTIWRRTGSGAVGRAAARPRRHHHGVVRPRLVSRRAPQRRCSTPTATPGRPPGGTAGWSAAGIRTPTAACSCNCWKTPAATAEKRWRARRTT